jgi:hypothetical protein
MSNLNQPGQFANRKSSCKRKGLRREPVTLLLWSLLPLPPSNVRLLLVLLVLHVSRVQRLER